MSKKKETPNYVKEAVLQYIEEKRSYYLIEMFTNGIPLHSYPESRNIIIKLLNGESVRKRGRQPLSRKDKDRNYRILTHVSQLVGAGLSSVNNYPDNAAETACKKVGEIYGLTGKYIYDNIWKPAEGSDTVKLNMEIGKNNKWILEF